MNRKEEIVNEMTILKTKMKVLKKELKEIVDDNQVNDIDYDDYDNNCNNPPYKQHPDYVKLQQDIKKYSDDKNMPMDLMMYYEYPDLYIEWYTYVNGKSPDKIYDKTLKKDIAYITDTDHKLNKLHTLKTLEDIIWPSGG
jgi:hypothetical protein